MTLEKELKEKCDAICSRYSKEEDPGFVEDAQEVQDLVLHSIININGIEVEPLWVETYLGTKAVPGNSHCKQKQMNRFGKLYFHKKGRGGVDLVLSTNDEKYYSVLIKACRIGEAVYSQLKVRGLTKEMNDETATVSLTEKKTVGVINHVERVRVANNEGLQLASFLGKEKSLRHSKSATKYRNLVKGGVPNNRP